MSSPLLDDDVAPPLPEEYEAPEGHRSLFQRAHDSLTGWFSRDEPSPQAPASGYMTLIPLSDARLQPPNAGLSALHFVVFAAVVASAVFILVPRGISIGGISVHADKISWNTTKHSYQLGLITELSVHNPNYLKASIGGTLKVLFYEAEAGNFTLEPTVLPARSMPQTLHFKIDASEVPAEYILAILTQCSTFPNQLIFFLEGNLAARFLWLHQRVSPVDTYFIIPCHDDHNIG